jgi:hypothetical protein
MRRNHVFRCAACVEAQVYVKRQIAVADALIPHAGAEDTMQVNLYADLI